MKSNKAEDYIKKHYYHPMLNGTNFISEHCAMNAVEIAEEDFKEKAIKAIKATICDNLCSCRTENCECLMIDRFINELNKEP